LFAAHHCAKATNFLKKDPPKSKETKKRVVILDLSQEKFKATDALVCSGHLKKVTWFFQSIRENPNESCQSK
jgi:hypothetical protein